MSGSLVVLNGPQAGLVVSIDRQPFVIGRGPHCSLNLEDERVSRTHAIITTQGSLFVIQNQGSNGTLINGVSIAQAYLNHGDQVSFGGIPFRFESAQILAQNPGTPPGATVVQTPGMVQTPVMTPGMIQVQPQAPAQWHQPPVGVTFSGFNQMWNSVGRRWIFLGAAAIFVSAFIPWVQVSGWGGSSGLNPTTALLAILGIVFGFMAFIPNDTSIITLILGILVSLGSLMVLFSGGSALFVSVGPGFGAFMGLAGGVMTTIGSYMGFSAHRR